MPKPRDFEKLTPQRQRIYRAICNLYIEAGKVSPSLEEIAAASNTKVPNVHTTVVWLEQREWLSRRPGKYRTIIPLVRLPKSR